MSSEAPGSTFFRTINTSHLELYLEKAVPTVVCVTRIEYRARKTLRGQSRTSTKTLKLLD